jgi:uncharacterized protein
MVMSEQTEHAAGTPSWADIGTDVEPAKSFYMQIFGWEPVDAGPPEETGGYGFFTKAGKMVAGFGPQQNPGPPVWAVYMATDNADETTALVERAGGQVVVAPMDVMTAGRMAVFADPAGAIFSVWQAGEHPGAQLMGEQGAICWVELNTRDVAAAKQFYPAVFGWKEETHEGEMPYTEFHLGEPAVAGMMAMPPQVPAEVPSHWLAYFGVDDVDASTDIARQLGAGVLAGPMDIPGGGRFSVLRDPQGATFGIYRGPA